MDFSEDDETINKYLSSWISASSASSTLPPDNAYDEIDTSIFERYMESETSDAINSITGLACQPCPANYFAASGNPPGSLNSSINSTTSSQPSIESGDLNDSDFLPHAHYPQYQRYHSNPGTILPSIDHMWGPQPMHQLPLDCCPNQQRQETHLDDQESGMMRMLMYAHQPERPPPPAYSSHMLMTSSTAWIKHEPVDHNEDHLYHHSAFAFVDQDFETCRMGGVNHVRESCCRLSATSSRERSRRSVKGGTSSSKNRAKSAIRSSSSAATREGKVYPCGYCGNVYLRSSHLKVHVRKHTGEKPFQCTYAGCEWRFRRSDELSRHKRCHSGIKPYHCGLCGKSFARSDHLSKHIRVHERNQQSSTITSPTQDDFVM